MLIQGLGLVSRYRNTVQARQPRPDRLWDPPNLSAYPQGKNPSYPMDRKVGGPQRQSGLYGEEKSLLPLPGIEPQSLYPLSYPCSHSHRRSSWFFFSNLQATSERVPCHHRFLLHALQFNYHLIFGRYIVWVINNVVKYTALYAYLRRNTHHDTTVWIQWTFDMKPAP
jgi:hypothetical protein